MYVCVSEAIFAWGGGKLDLTHGIPGNLFLPVCFLRNRFSSGLSVKSVLKLSFRVLFIKI